MKISRCFNKSTKFISTKQLIVCLLLVEITASDLLGPIATKALINGTATLHCRIKLKVSYDRIKVQWLKDGFGYENETLRDYFNGRYRMPGPKELGIYDLVIQSLENQDDGEYACQINAAVQNRPNSNILKTSKSINLTVIVPPKVVMISPYPSNNNSVEYVDKQIDVIWGKIKGFIEINCQILKSRPAAKLEWSLGKYLIREGKLGDIEGYEIGSVITKTVALNDADQFYFKTESHLRLRLRRDHNGELLKCSVVNKEDFLDHTPEPKNVLINVLYVADVKIDVLPHRPYYQFSEHETITINCSASTNPTLIIYNWIKYDPQTGRLSIIKSSAEHGILKLKISRDLNKMFIRCQIIASTKNHICKPIIDSGSEISETIILNNCSSSNIAFSSNQIPMRVRYSPVIFDSVLETKSAFLGDVVSMECNADSNPPSKISWYKSSLTLKEIMSNPEIRSHEFYKDFSAKPHSMLSLISVSTRHQFTVTDADKLGLFICIARANGFSPAQKAVFVGQGATPQIVNNHKVIVAKAGSSIRIPCHIFSIPLPKKEDIQWFKNSKIKPLKPKPKDQVYHEDRLAGLVSYLYIHRVSSTDYGVYNCSVINLYGHASDTIELISPAETPLIFIIGSSCAVILAIIFAFIIFCIIRTSKARSLTNNHGPIYSKGHILSPCNSLLNRETVDTGFANSYTDGAGDFRNDEFFKIHKKNIFDPPCLNAPQSNLNDITGMYFDSNNLKHAHNYLKDDQFEISVLQNMDHQTIPGIYQSRPNWMDCPNTQLEAANESTRSYDSGVCPDESNLTSSGSHQPMYSTSIGLSPYQIFPCYQQSKNILDSAQCPSQICHQKMCNVSNNLLSSMEISSPCCTNAFTQYIDTNKPISENIFPKMNYNTPKSSSVPPDLTVTNDSMLPYIIAYSPTNVSMKKFNWTTKNQTTKL